MSAEPNGDGGSAVLVHGTAIALGQRGILIRGESGFGKSDLALRALFSLPSDASPDIVRLISDDQVWIAVQSQGLMMWAPPQIQGKLEVRGVGLIDLSRKSVAQDAVRLELIVDLVRSPSEIERLPERYCVEILGGSVDALKLYPFEVSAVEKLRLAAQSGGS